MEDMQMLSLFYSYTGNNEAISVKWQESGKVIETSFPERIYCLN